MSISLSSKKRLEFNVTSTFIELAITGATIWNRDGAKILKEGRAAGSPFIIHNRTGYSIVVWSDSDRKANSKPIVVKRLGDGQSIPWRFEDHRRLREVSEV
jgi:vacuolar protein sorting-associated protein 13A/C